MNSAQVVGDRLSISRTSKEYHTYPPVRCLRVALRDWKRVRMMVGKMRHGSRQFREAAWALLGLGVPMLLHGIASLSTSPPSPSLLREVYWIVGIVSLVAFGLCIGFDRLARRLTRMTVSDVLEEMDDIARHSGMSEEVAHELYAPGSEQRDLRVID